MKTNSKNQDNKNAKPITGTNTILQKNIVEIERQ